MTVDYIKMYEQLKRGLKWKVTDNRIIMMIAGLYVSKNKELRIEHFLEIAESIKKQAGMFSSIRSHSRFTTAAMLDTHFTSPEIQIKPLFDLYDQLISLGFKRGTFTYIAATVILTNDHETMNSTEVAEKAQEIYQRMKNEHMFLTSNSDYPLATLLAFEEGTVDVLVDRMEQFYNKLGQNGFRKGNDLQFLSHILSLEEQGNIDVLVNQANSVFNRFKQAGISPKGKYYPVIGMLTLLPSAELNMEEILQIYDQLNKEKHFKWQKDMNLITAVNFFTSNKLINTSLSETSIFTTMEVIMQAQQAAMVAVMASSTAAAASASGGGN